MFDLGMVSHVCPCGSRMWILDWVIFDEYEIAAHALEMSCKLCGTRALAPTLPDSPEYVTER